MKENSKMLKYITKLVWNNDDQVISIANCEKVNFENYMSKHEEFAKDIKEISDIDFDGIVDGFREYMGNKNTKSLLDICQRLQ